MQLAVHVNICFSISIISFACYVVVNKTFCALGWWFNKTSYCPIYIGTGWRMWHLKDLRCLFFCTIRSDPSFPSSDCNVISQRRLPSQLALKAQFSRQYREKAASIDNSGDCLRFISKLKPERQEGGKCGKGKEQRSFNANKEEAYFFNVICKCHNVL